MLYVFHLSEIAHRNLNLKLFDLMMAFCKISHWWKYFFFVSAVPLKVPVVEHEDHLLQLVPHLLQVQGEQFRKPGGANVINKF